MRYCPHLEDRGRRSRKWAFRLRRPIHPVPRRASLHKRYSSPSATRVGVLGHLETNDCARQSIAVSSPYHLADYVALEGGRPKSRRRAGSGSAPTREVHTLATIVTRSCRGGRLKGYGYGECLRMLPRVWRERRLSGRRRGEGVPLLRAQEEGGFQVRLVPRCPPSDGNRGHR